MRSARAGSRRSSGSARSAASSFLPSSASGRARPKTAAFAGPAGVDPEVRPLAYVDVHEAAHGIDADAVEAFFACELGDVFVRRAGHHEVHRAAFAVVRGGAAAWRAIAGDDPDLGR